jgi:Ras-related protein Rab-18
MAAEESATTLKILIIGPSGAGKSACEDLLRRNYPHRPANPPPVLIRYCDDQFDSESSTATIGVDFKVGCFPLLALRILIHYSSRNYLFMANLTG